MSGLVPWHNLIGILLPALVLGSYALLRYTGREGFFSYYYFAYASASGLRPAPGRWYQE